MARLARLASTLTARYFPSQNITDAFYLDGRLFGKRETRSADITLDKEEKGFFYSVFSHPTIPGYEPGMLPPYEPQLRDICNEVKYGKKEIDTIVSQFLATAVEVTGKMKLQDQEVRNPYFSGVIVKEAEMFAVTIGTGLAFLYRNDTLYPLTDAGIPMEPIDAFGNRVSDFTNYMSSKKANAQWSNITTLSMNDCIILCNKEVYDALGQREILRILDEAEDQCDAAGMVITLASAKMPNVPMQFSISFVESITVEEKRGLFGFRKKNKEEEDQYMSVESSFDTGVVGEAAKSISGNASFEAPEVPQEEIPTAIMFGDTAIEGAASIAAAGAGVANAAAAANAGISSAEMVSADPFATPVNTTGAEEKIEFLDKSITEPEVTEISAEDMMKKLYADMKSAEPVSAQEVIEKVENKPAEEPVDDKASEGIVIEEDAKEETPFVGGFNPFDMGEAVNTTADEVKIETVGQVLFETEEDDSGETKAIADLSKFISEQEEINKSDANLMNSSDSIDAKEEGEVELKTDEDIVKEDEPQPVTEVDGSIVFEVNQNNNNVNAASGANQIDMNSPFNPYNAGDTNMNSGTPFVFGGHVIDEIPEEVKVEDANTIGQTTAASESEEEVKINLLDWDESTAPTIASAETYEEPVVGDDLSGSDMTTAEESQIQFVEKPQAFEDGASFVLPFAEEVEVKAANEVDAKDIPDMPVYDADTYDSPAYAVGSEQEINAPSDAYVVGQYNTNEEAAQTTPYQTFGEEAFDYTSQGMEAAMQVGIENSQDGYAEPNYGEQTYTEQSYGEQQVYGEQPYGEQQVYGEQPYGEQQAYANQSYGEQAYAEQGYGDAIYGEQSYGEQPYMEQQDAYNQSAYAGDYETAQQDPYASYEQESPVSNEYGEDGFMNNAGNDEWIDNILGIDDVDSGFDYQEDGYSYANQNAGGSNVASGYAPVAGPQGQGARPVNGGAGKGSNGGSGNRNGNGGNGGNGRRPASSGGQGPRRRRKLSRNGIIFLTTVGVLLICFVLLISAIVKACSKDDKKDEETKETTTETTTVETTIPTETTVNPSAPIGVWVFSTDTGYRTWWDVFYNVYGVELEDESDSRIDIFIQYNGLDPEVYRPSAGDALVIPPAGVINGSIPFTPIGSTTETTAPVEGAIEGSAAISGETPAETPAESADPNATSSTAAAV